MNLISKDTANTLREEIELMEGIYPEFNKNEYLDGELQPVFLVRL